MAALLYRLRNLGDARRFHDGRLALPFGKAGRLVLVCVDATELLTVRVRNGHQPVMMLPAAIFTKGGLFPSYSLLFSAVCQCSHLTCLRVLEISQGSGICASTSTVDNVSMW